MLLIEVATDALQWSKSNWVQVAGVLAFLWGLYQYWQAQKWKRLEFVAKEVKEFENDHEVECALTMLEWRDATIEFWPDEAEEKEQWDRVDDASVMEALDPEDDYEAQYTDTECAVLDAFDSFFGYLELFEHYIASGLVNYQDFELYLAHWLKIILDPAVVEKPDGYRTILFKYIDANGYTGVRHLLQRYRDAHQLHKLPEVWKRKGHRKLKHKTKNG